jgi:hypothetical protein
MQPRNVHTKQPATSHALKLHVYESFVHSFVGYLRKIPGRNTWSKARTTLLPCSHPPPVTITLAAIKIYDANKQPARYHAKSAFRTSYEQQKQAKRLCNKASTFDECKPPTNKQSRLECLNPQSTQCSCPRPRRYMFSVSLIEQWMEKLFIAFFVSRPSTVDRRVESMNDNKSIST